MQLILVSGLSGSGKSIALNVLEDSGYYCVDNLPAKLLPDTVHFLQESGYTQIAKLGLRRGDGALVVRLSLRKYQTEASPKPASNKPKPAAAETKPEAGRKPAAKKAPAK